MPNAKLKTLIESMVSEIIDAEIDETENDQIQNWEALQDALAETYRSPLDAVSNETEDLINVVNENFTKLVNSLKEYNKLQKAFAQGEAIYGDKGNQGKGYAIEKDDGSYEIFRGNDKELYAAGYRAYLKCFPLIKNIFSTCVEILKTTDKAYGTKKAEIVKPFLQNIMSGIKEVVSGRDKEMTGNGSFFKGMHPNFIEKTNDFIKSFDTRRDLKYGNQNFEIFLSFKETINNLRNDISFQVIFDEFVDKIANVIGAISVESTISRTSQIVEFLLEQGGAGDVDYGQGMTSLFAKMIYDLKDAEIIADTILNILERNYDKHNRFNHENTIKEATKKPDKSNALLKLYNQAIDDTSEFLVETSENSREIDQNVIEPYSNLLRALKEYNRLQKALFQGEAVYGDKGSQGKGYAIEKDDGSHEIFRGDDKALRSMAYRAYLKCFPLIKKAMTASLETLKPIDQLYGMEKTQIAKGYLLPLMNDLKEIATGRDSSLSGEGTFFQGINEGAIEKISKIVDSMEESSGDWLVQWNPCGVISSIYGKVLNAADEEDPDIESNFFYDFKDSLGDIFVKAFPFVNSITNVIFAANALIEQGGLRAHTFEPHTMNEEMEYDQDEKFIIANEIDKIIHKKYAESMEETGISRINENQDEDEPEVASPKLKKTILNKTFHNTLEKLTKDEKKTTLFYENLKDALQKLFRSVKEYNKLQKVLLQGEAIYGDKGSQGKGYAIQKDDGNHEIFRGSDKEMYSMVYKAYLKCFPLVKNAFSAMIQTLKPMDEEYGFSLSKKLSNVAVEAMSALKEIAAGRDEKMSGEGTFFQGMKIENVEKLSRFVEEAIDGLDLTDLTLAETRIKDVLTNSMTDALIRSLTNVTDDKTMSQILKDLTMTHLASRFTRPKTIFIDNFSVIFDIIFIISNMLIEQGGYPKLSDELGDLGSYMYYNTTPIYEKIRKMVNADFELERNGQLT